MGVQIQKLLITLVLVVACSETGSCTIKELLEALEAVAKLKPTFDAIENPRGWKNTAPKAPNEEILYTGLALKLSSISTILPQTILEILQVNSKFQEAFSKVKIVSKKDDLVLKAGIIESEGHIPSIDVSVVICTNDETTSYVGFTNPLYNSWNLNISKNVTSPGSFYIHPDLQLNKVLDQSVNGLGVGCQIKYWNEQTKDPNPAWQLEPVEDWTQGMYYYIRMGEQVLQANGHLGPVTLAGRDPTNDNQKWSFQKI